MLKLVLYYKIYTYVTFTSYNKSVKLVYLNMIAKPKIFVMLHTVPAIIGVNGYYKLIL